jgi:hypothetical protein
METRTRTGAVRRPKRRKPSASANMRAYRERMRAAGMRQVQIWVPDSTSPSLRREARRQSLLVSRSAGEKEAIAEVEAIADIEGWE